MATVPRQNDVLMGKGTAINSHPGNKHLRNLVELHKPRFIQTKRTEKRNVAIEIIKQIESAGGRFLMEDPNLGRKGGKGGSVDRPAQTVPAGRAEGIVTDPFLLEMVWVPVEKGKAIDKVMHRLREKRVGPGPQKPPPEESMARNVAVSSYAMAADNAHSCARAGPHTNEDAKLESNTLSSYNVGTGLSGAQIPLGVQSMLQQPVASGFSTMNGFGLAAFPARTQPSLQALAASMSQGGGLASACASFGIQSASQPLTPNISSMAGLVNVHSASQLQASSMRMGGFNLATGPVNIPSAQQAQAPSVHSTGVFSHAAGSVHVPSACQMQVPSVVSGGLNCANDPASIPSSAPQPPVNPSSNMKGPPGAPVPISIKYWIRLSDEMSLSRDDYLKSAIDLSLSLTKHLIQKIDASDILLSDISEEKVSILVDPASPTQSSGGVPIHGVEFQSSVLLLLSMAQQTSTSPLSPRSVCAALGNILLEVFSRGQSSSQGFSTVATASLHGTQLGSSIMPPMKKGKMSLQSDGSMASMVSILLIGLGMPMSILRLVGDLLEAVDEHRPDSAYTALEDVVSDLTRMRDDPEHYLFDRTCPQKALDDTGFFANSNSQLFGRGREIKALMDAKKKISDHVLKEEEVPSSDSNGGEVLTFDEMNSFLCELVVLSGYAGAGKSSLLNSLRASCKEEGWFVLSWNNEKTQSPVKVLTKAFDDFFRTWASKKQSGAQSGVQRAMLDSFDQVCQSISTSIDNEGLRQLCEMIPSLSQVFPEIVSARSGDQATSSIEKVGSAKKRFMYMMHVIIESLCTSGRPVLLVHDDLQWANSLDGLKDLILNHVNDSSNIWDTCRKGLLIVGAYRTNEMQDRQDLLGSMNSIEQSHNASVTKLAVDELSVDDISELISQKLCLPTRYTKNLARLVHSKTRGNPFFIIQFLKTIIQNGMLEFSVSHRRWTWDCDVIDMQMISDGVAELLISRFNQLPDQLMQTAMVVSCLGSEIEDETLKLLNAGQPLLPFDMQEALQLAVKAGIMDSAGPIYQFTHDIVQQTIYDAIPINQRLFLHKSIGERLLGAAADNPTLHSLAVDQINIYAKDAALSSEERSRYATCNAAAARFAISASSFDQARTYVNAGMKMLDADHWEKQYPLSLELYEMSATVSSFHGDTGTMSSCLMETIANVRSFEDSLTSSILLAKLLAASSKFDEAVSNCLTVLSSLGEEFPPEIDMPLVVSELSVIQTTLATITVEQVKLLPRMQNKTKLHAMKFMSMLCSYAIRSKPLLVPILSCRMVRLTIEEGFCDDSIVGLVTAGYSLFAFKDDIALGYRIGKVGESLIEESPNMHALRSRLSHELDSNLKLVVEPIQTVVSAFPDRYKSAMMTGDVDMAMLSLVGYCIGKLHVGENLFTLSKSYIACIKQSIQYGQNTTLYLAMSSFGACMYLSGRSYEEVDVKSFEALDEIGKRTNHISLLHLNFINKMSSRFWMRDYVTVAELAAQQKVGGLKRPLHYLVRTFFEGIASLNLARQTHQPHWRKAGEAALVEMSKWVSSSTWNFEHKEMLLQAELHYLNGDLEAADESYNASISAARVHKFIHHEALATELYGVFLIENQVVDKGATQLRLALKKYEMWGAMKKVEQLQEFLALVEIPLN